MCSWLKSSHLLHRPLQSHSVKTDFPFPFPWTSGKSVKGVPRCLYLRTNTQQSGHNTNDHNTGNWDSVAWQCAVVLFGAQQTTPKLSAAPNKPNHKVYKIRFPDFWPAQNWKVCGTPCISDETEGLFSMGDLIWLCTKVGHKNAVKTDTGHLKAFSKIFSPSCSAHANFGGGAHCVFFSCILRTTSEMTSSIAKTVASVLQLWTHQTDGRLQI